MNLFLRWILPFLGLVLLALGGAAMVERVRGPSPREVADGLRIEMEGIRTRVDACLATRARVELRFQAHVRETGRLRAAVDSLEALDPQGVPEGVYDEYLGLVEQFNAATREWEVLSAELQTQDPRCRELISAHNALGDSARRILAEAGVLELLRPPEEWGDGSDSTYLDPSYLNSTDTDPNP